MKHINLETFAGGAFTEQINRAIEEVTKNIQDPNTEDKKVRKITVTIGFKPNAQRNFSTIGIETKVSLAQTLGVVTAMSMGKDLKTGDVDVIEIGNQIPGQLSMNDMQPNIQNVGGHDVDLSTGEILEETPMENKVINLRKNA
ncbi:MAG: hypothetical protein IJZ53_07450 [Tyzzerella sp.]|nr:hypothetical protein [Tyzzerella sp.]